jgi:2EXR family
MHVTRHISRVGCHLRPFHHFSRRGEPRKCPPGFLPFLFSISTLLREPNYSYEPVSHPLLPSEIVTFQDLPAEIRCMIWQHYLSIPRVIAVRTAHKHRSHSKIYFSPCNPLLHVNREARLEALRVLQVYSPMIEGSRKLRYGPPFYINCEKDVIWFVDLPEYGLPSKSPSRGSVAAPALCAWQRRGRAPSVANPPMGSTSDIFIQ